MATQYLCTYKREKIKFPSLIKEKKPKHVKKRHDNKTLI